MSTPISVQRSALLGPNGSPISSTMFKKASPPKIGPAFGDWANADAHRFALPGGAMLQMDTSQLTLADFRVMRDHPQVNASLMSLTFMLHQVDWHISCEDKKIAEDIEENLRRMWLRLIRAMSQALWSGYSPTIIEYENGSDGRIDISKFKDMQPELCQPNWKLVEGYAPPGRTPPKHKVFDGMKVSGAPYPVPPDNTLWYPLLMENGNYFGRKLLKAAFAPWYFSILIHLFANRYYERFGEPVPIGRAPLDDTVDVGDGTPIPAKQAMEMILTSLRSRSVVILPSDKDPVNKEPLWDIEYLESQMRGADFERYLARLDEEISLALFTPMLLMRTAGEGSHNLGVQHTQTWLWILNALCGDMKEYIDRYVCERLKALNFSPKAPRVEWKFRPMGKDNVQTLQAALQALMTGTATGQSVHLDINELGQALGLSLTEAKALQEKEPDPEEEEVEGEDKKDEKDTRVRTRPRGRSKPRGVGEPRATGREISSRVRAQVENAFANGTFNSEFRPTLGYERRMATAFRAEGFTSDESKAVTDRIYSNAMVWIENVVALGPDEFSGPQDFMALFDRMLDNELTEAADV